MAQTIASKEIVDQMLSMWQSFPNSEFYFGNPQEVDNIHNKTLPLMVMNTPEMKLTTQNWEKNKIDIESNWTFIVYDNIPSTYNVTDDTKILELWDTMENQIFTWFYLWWYYFEGLGHQFVMTSPIQLTRLKESSNDRLLAIKVTFGFNFFRLCRQVY